jgi:hypothetical protein
MIRTIILQADTPKETVSAILSSLNKTHDFVRISRITNDDYCLLIAIEGEQDFADVLGTIVEVAMNVPIKKVI